MLLAEVEVAQRYVVSGGGRRSKVCLLLAEMDVAQMYVVSGGGGRSKVTSCSGRSNVQFAEVTHRS